MYGSAVSDSRGVVHRVVSEPNPFLTSAGGIPGNTLCGVLFYASEFGPKSCTLPHPHVKPMRQTEEPVNCMACLVQE